MTHSRRVLLAAVAGLGLASAANAQTNATSPNAAASPASPAAASTQAARPAGAPMPIRGVIEQVSDHELRIVTRAGEKVALKIADNVNVTWIEPISVEAIKPGAFIGTAAVPQPDGTLKALEIQVFPESMRGIGEGHRAWNLGANSSMTNGTVGDVKVANGRTLTLTYKGGEQTVFVPEKAPVITYEPATRAALKKGEHVILFATQGPDETLTAGRIGVGKNGLVPPM